MHEVKKLWGKEEIIVNNELYCLKKMTLNEGYQCSLHYHLEKDETFIIDSGIMNIEVDDKMKTLYDGDIVRIKPNQKHRFSALTNDVVFYEVSTHDNVEDSFRLEESKKI